MSIGSTCSKGSICLAPAKSYHKKKSFCCDIGGGSINLEEINGINPIDTKKKRSILPNSHLTKEFEHPYMYIM